MSANPPELTPSSPHELLSLGAIETLLKDPSINEVMINDTRNIMVEKSGKTYFSGFSLQLPSDLDALVAALCQRIGKDLSPGRPYADGILSDGSRVHLIGPPATLGGTCITIRKFPSLTFNLEDLASAEMMSPQMGQFLAWCATAKINVLISGGTSSGKTTLLNALIGYISRTERLVTIEDTPELRIPHPNSVRTLSAPHSLGGISPRELIYNSLRMRPDRVIIGECRGGEALDMLQAMNTGHAGSMTTIHANTARDALSRLETLCLMSGVELPLMAVRKQIVSALDLVVQVSRTRTGKRKVMSISEVVGIEGEIVTLQELFTCLPEGDSGKFVCTGFVPTLLGRLHEAGLDIPSTFFN